MSNLFCMFVSVNNQYLNQMDLFNEMHLVPKEVKAILETHDDNADQYKELTRLVKAIEPLGYTFDFYLDAEPYNLRKIVPQKVEMIMWESIQRDCKLPKEDNNDGYIYGLNLIDVEGEGDIIDVQWFKESEERDTFITENNLEIIQD